MERKKKKKRLNLVVCHCGVVITCEVCRTAFLGGIDCWLSHTESFGRRGCARPASPGGVKALSHNWLLAGTVCEYKFYGIGILSMSKPCVTAVRWLQKNKKGGYSFSFTCIC